MNQFKLKPKNSYLFFLFINRNIMTKKIIYLNTAMLDTNGKIVSGSKNLEFRFDVPGMEVRQGAKMKVINFCHVGTHTGTVYIFKIKDTLINNSYYYGNDGSYPTLLACNLANNVPNFNLGSELTLNKQSINFINLQIESFNFENSKQNFIFMDSKTSYLDIKTITTV